MIVRSLIKQKNKSNTVVVVADSLPDFSLNYINGSFCIIHNHSILARLVGISYIDSDLFYLVPSTEYSIDFIKYKKIWVIPKKNIDFLNRDKNSLYILFDVNSIFRNIKLYYEGDKIDIQMEYKEKLFSLTSGAYIKTEGNDIHSFISASAIFMTIHHAALKG